MAVNPIELQKHLDGANYPASPQDLADLAKSNGADDDVVDALSSMPDDSYDGPDAVREALRQACAAFGPSGTSVDLPIPATPEAVFWALEKARGAYETVAEPTRREPVEV